MCVECATHVSNDAGYPLRSFGIPGLGVNLLVDFVAFLCGADGRVTQPLGPGDAFPALSVMSTDYVCCRCHAPLSLGDLVTPESVIDPLPVGFSRLVCTLCRPVVFLFEVDTVTVSVTPVSHGRGRSQVRPSPLKRCSHKRNGSGGAFTRRARSRLSS